MRAALSLFEYSRDGGFVHGIFLSGPLAPAVYALAFPVYNLAVSAGHDVISARTAATTIEVPRFVPGRSVRITEPVGVEDEVLSLFDGFRDPLLRYVCAFGISVGDGEDLIQDVFLALFRHLQHGGSRSNLPGWLFRVAHNLTLKLRARQQQERANVVCASEAQGTPDTAPDPELSLASRQRQARVCAVLHALPERDRQCVRLRGAGLRYRDIARVLGMSLGAVSKSLARAVARLERAVEH
jgi:RNA polymerase sigma-70 factor (ECF subfamily)